MAGVVIGLHHGPAIDANSLPNEVVLLLVVIVPCCCLAFWGTQPISISSKSLYLLHQSFKVADS
mgnify:CR=1 FL=1